MTLETKRIVIAALGGLFLLSLVLVQWMETARKAEESGLRPPTISIPAESRECVECHAQANPGIVEHVLRQALLGAIDRRHVELSLLREADRRDRVGIPRPGLHGNGAVFV